jgi:Tol biopolymer transport system component
MIRRLALPVLLLTALPGAAAAQYFGQNKVQYSKFEFDVIKTEHFDVHYYPREREAAYDAARMAERSYARLSRLLNHTFKERKPIILYASQSDFAQTNAVGTDFDPGDATGGVTDFYRHRAVLPFTGSYREFEHVLMHEMVHQFQYDIWSRGTPGAGLSTLIAINPPLWFAEGMAEFLSLGPMTPETEMWIRDATVEGRLPSVEQMTLRPYEFFPYRFGHAFWSWISERWGDEAVGAILQGTLAGGVEGAFRRVTGMPLAQLSAQWQAEMQRRFLPEIGNRVKARTVANPLITRDRDDGQLHLAPALSPDGKWIAYLSERGGYFMDAWLADARTGQVKRRLLRSSLSPDYESLRYLSASGAWSADSRFLAYAVKRGPRDDIVILDVERNKVVQRLEVDLNGITNPTWSPDGRRVAFTGYDGGLSDLFVIDRETGELTRLTSDRYADLQPAWSPDGRRLAFVTDRGPKTDFEHLAFGNLGLGLYEFATGRVEVVPGTDVGKNISPQWAPDGRSIAFVSDRGGISNIFLADLEDGQVYQLTNFYTGAQGVTPLSPVLTWAAGVDRLAFVYFERTNTDIYTLDQPRELRRAPWTAPLPPGPAPELAAEVRPPPVPTDSAPPRPEVRQGGSLYRTPGGFRAADQVRAPGDTSTRPLPGPVSVRALLDSARFALPDSSEFTDVPYNPKLSLDYAVRPSIGYTRDNFGSGFYGGSAVQFSDMLGNRQLTVAGFINGRIEEAELYTGYANFGNRIIWGASLSQTPYFFYRPSEIRLNEPGPGQNTFVTIVRRQTYRTAQASLFRPTNRFRRFEVGLQFTAVEDDILEIREPFQQGSGIPTGDPRLVEISLGDAAYVAPSLAHVWDNTLFGWVSPISGRRSRIELLQAFGGWTFTQGLFDYRRYDPLPGPFVFATRFFYAGRKGTDAERFSIFLGNTSLIRGHTAGSYERNECSLDDGTVIGCAGQSRLIGTEVAVANFELRFPILNPSMGVSFFPPIEGAFFYDVGIAWEEGNVLRWSRQPGDHPINVRTPLSTLGVALRMNFFGLMLLRADWNFPQNRGIGSYWTISLGPTF